MLISVYGTLRKGCGANYKMDNTEFIGISKENVNFKMLHLGGFPGLVKSEEKNELVFETYKIKDDDKDTLRILDQYEGYPSFYDRCEIELENLGVKSWVYYLKNDKEYNGGRNQILSGDWVNQ